MKVRLLKKLRRQAQSEITINSITRTDGVTTGMSIGMNDSCYSGIFSMGDSVQDIYNKVFKIFLAKNIERIRSKYKKYSIKKQ